MFTGLVQALDGLIYICMYRYHYSWSSVRLNTITKLTISHAHIWVSQLYATSLTSLLSNSRVLLLQKPFHFTENKLFICRNAANRQSHSPDLLDKLPKFPLPAEKTYSFYNTQPLLVQVSENRFNSNVVFPGSLIVLLLSSSCRCSVFYRCQSIKQSVILQKIP